jgi:hypothetical protein
MRSFPYVVLQLWCLLVLLDAHEPKGPFLAKNNPALRASCTGYAVEAAERVSVQPIAPMLLAHQQ